MVTPGSNGKAVAHAREHHEESEHQACALVSMGRRVICCEPSQPNEGVPPQRAAQARGGMSSVLLLPSGLSAGSGGHGAQPQQLLRIYREEGLQVRRHGGRKRELGAHTPMPDLC